MKKLLLVGLALLLLVLPAASAEAGGRHYYRGGWGWGWGWGWGGWGWGGWGGWGWGGYYPYGRVVAWERVPGPAWTVVDTDVSPEHAELWLDGVYIGVADDFDGNPDYLYLGRGDYKLEFRLGGYQTLQVNVQGRSGFVSVDEWMQRAPDTPKVGDGNRRAPEIGYQRFWVKKNGQTQVYVEQENASREVAESDEGLSVEAETWSRRQEPPAAGTTSPPPPAGEESSGSWRGRSAPAAPAAGSAAFLIAVEPADAAVWVDHKFVGSGADLSASSRGVPVEPGKHEITVARPGWGTETINVEVESGEIRRVRVSLKKD
jgi:hypothetical protein